MPFYDPSDWELLQNCLIPSFSGCACLWPKMAPMALEKGLKRKDEPFMTDVLTVTDEFSQNCPQHLQVKLEMSQGI